MACYGQLLLLCGGGVIDHAKQVERQDEATLVIGLGGTGSDAVMKLKREVFKQLKPDDEQTAIPTYAAIKYLIVDSDDSKINAQTGRFTDIDRNTEYFDLSHCNIRKIFRTDELLKKRPEFYWLDYEHMAIDQARESYGGIRQIGRLRLVDQALALYEKIKSEMQSALSFCNNGKLTVHICTGLCGGTGSGAFLDVCYLVRLALQEIEKEDATVCGYFFMPDVNLSVPEIMRSSLLSQYIKVNGYAALQELDYCMNFANNKDSFRMDYGFTKVDFKTQPIDMCYLISAMDSEGNRIDNGYCYAMNLVTNHIINFMAKNFEDLCESEKNSGKSLAESVSEWNCLRAGIALQHGANVNYNIFGVAIAEIPYTEINTYLGARLFEYIRPMYNEVPTEKEREEFLIKNQLQYENLCKSLTANCPGVVNFPTSYDANMYNSRVYAVFVQCAADFLASNKGEMEKKLCTMTEENAEFNIPKKSTSLISRTYKALCDSFVINLDFGPFYAKRMLFGGNNQNLIHAVDGYIVKNNENLVHELCQSQLRDDEYEQAKKRMDSADIPSEKKCMEEYLNALNNLYVHRYRIEQFKTMGNLLEQYKSQLLTLDNNYFAVLPQLQDSVRNSIEENARVLSDGVREGNPSICKILSVKDIKVDLDKVVENMDLNQTLYSLMIDLLENREKWINQDENEITKMISDFILGQFQSATKKTMTDYLKEKFGVDNPTMLEQKIEDEIIRKKLWSKSKPLFWKNYFYYNQIGEQNVLTVPYDASEICHAANDFAAKERTTIRKTNTADRMSVMRTCIGLPLYAYQGLQELESAYEADNQPGRHLYERGEVDWNQLLPSPIPASFRIGTLIERIEKSNAELITEFEKAKELGIIIKDPIGNWEILTTDELQAQPKPLRIQTPNAVPGSEDLVMMDFYLKSPVLNEKVREELRKKGKMDEKIRKNG